MSKQPVGSPLDPSKNSAAAAKAKAKKKADDSDKALPPDPKDPDKIKAPGRQ
jgi:hypothetical protein